MWIPRLIASDVDGTLLHPSDTVTQRTVAAVAAVLSADVPFVLASGRPPGWISRVARAAGLTGHAICLNGTVLYDLATDRVISTRTLSPMLLEEIVSTLTQELPNVTVAAQRIANGAEGADGADLVTEPQYEHPWHGDRFRVVPRAELLDHPAVTLLVRQADASSEQLAKAAIDLLGDAVHITFSSNMGIIEITAPGTTKADRLAEVAERAGVTDTEVAAFGDMPNDLSMLRWAGLSVAVANAHPDVLAAADEITLSNAEDGVAAVLERWFTP